MVVRVKGSPEAVQIALNNYIRVTTTSSERSVEDLRRFYYSRFLSNLRADMSDALERKMKVKAQEVVEASSEASGVSEVEKAVSVTETPRSSMDLFRKMAQTAKAEAVKTEEVTSSQETQSGMNAFRNLAKTVPVVEVNGTYIDDIVVVANEPKEVQKEVKEEVQGEVHGSYVEDIEVLKPLVSDEELSAIEESVLEKSAPVVFGVFVEDIAVVPHEEKRVSEVAEKVSEVHGVYINDIQVAEKRESVKAMEPMKPVTEGTSKVVEQVVQVQEAPQGGQGVQDSGEKQESLPTTVREYVKKHGGSCSVEVVKKLYPRKQIEKEMVIGKIIRRGSKYFI